MAGLATREANDSMVTAGNPKATVIQLASNSSQTTFKVRYDATDGRTD